MKATGELQAWLPWVIKIRFVIITFVFAIAYAIQQVVPSSAGSHAIVYLGISVIFWYVLNLFFLIYNQLSRDYALQAHLQIYSDLVIITAIVHVTGDLDSNYFSLYLVAIILATILLRRAQAFLVAGVSFVLMGSLFELAYLPSLYPEFAFRYPAFRILATSSQLPMDLGPLQVKIFASLFGFFAVCYLASFLAESLRKTGAELEFRSGQVANLQALNENVIHSMRDGLLATNMEGRILESNPAGADILGIKTAELKGRSIHDVLDGLPAMPSADDGRREVCYHRPEGAEQVLGISASPLVVPDKGPLGYVYNVRDLTVEKRREAEYRAKDRMATLGRMAAGIAHEIRNPLASIAGSVKVLRMLADLDDDQRKLIDIVSHESERLNKLVSDFLVYARDRAMEFRRVDLLNLLDETLLLVEHHPLFGRGYRLERKIPRRAVAIEADPDRIRQVFWNICDNALKAMPEGGTLGVEMDEGRGETVRITFWDTGRGFTARQLEGVFEPFQPGFADGTGLGLAIVYQIVEGHRGRIQVESAPGKGARFVLDLPRYQPQAAAQEVEVPERR